MKDYDAIAKAEHPNFKRTDLGKPRCILCGIVFNWFDELMDHIVKTHKDLLKCRAIHGIKMEYPSLDHMTTLDLVIMRADSIRCRDDDFVKYLDKTIKERMCQSTQTPHS